jgi:hypothetical protein
MGALDRMDVEISDKWTTPDRRQMQRYLGRPEEPSFVLRVNERLFKIGATKRATDGWSYYIEEMDSFSLNGRLEPVPKDPEDVDLERLDLPTNDDESAVWTLIHSLAYDQNRLNRWLDEEGFGSFITVRTTMDVL